MLQLTLPECNDDIYYVQLGIFDHQLKLLPINHPPPLPSHPLSSHPLPSHPLLLWQDLHCHADISSHVKPNWVSLHWWTLEMKCETKVLKESNVSVRTRPSSGYTTQICTTMASALLLSSTLKIISSGMPWCWLSLSSGPKGWCSFVRRIWQRVDVSCACLAFFSDSVLIFFQWVECNSLLRAVWTLGGDKYTEGSYLIR